MKSSKLFFSKLAIVTLVCLNSLDARSDQEPYADKDWKVRAGAGALYMPAFLGSDEYQVMMVPDLRIAYKDKFFASMPEGVGYNVIHAKGWRVGPVAKIDFGREEDGESTFQVGGSDTTALEGLGDIDESLELGGFAEYSWDNISAKAELRQGIDGHEGLVADFNLNFKTKISGVFDKEGAPIIISAGPRATLVNDSYNESYFGITQEQSARSGLPRYTAEGGLLTYGVGAMMVVPLGGNLSTSLFTGYDRLAQDAADSPLVQQRGSESQARLGVFLSYNF